MLILTWQLINFFTYNFVSINFEIVKFVSDPIRIYQDLVSCWLKSWPVSWSSTWYWKLYSPSSHLHSLYLATRFHLQFRVMTCTLRKSSWCPQCSESPVAVSMVVIIPGMGRVHNQRRHNYQYSYCSGQMIMTNKSAPSLIISLLWQDFALFILA